MNTYQRLFLFLLIPSILFSQDITNASGLDKEYLDSLPEGVRNDLLARMESDKLVEEPVYRLPQTKLEKKIELEQLTGIFGENFFTSIQTSFMPINEPNFDGSYILDFGDVLQIQLIGQKNSIEDLPIKRDGSINMPDIGKISLSGLPLKEATDLIKSRVKNAYIGTEGFISLVNVRDIQVLIAGHSFNPGVYTLNGNSNILHALNMSGGMDLNGSYRKIKLIRNDETIEIIDLYDLFIFGKNTRNARLRSGDTILIEPSDSVVTVSAGVKRPGKYEMKKSENLEDLIEFANGLSTNVDTSSLKVNRVNQGKINTFNINFDSVGSFKLQNLDTVLITEFQYKKAIINGAVKNPGEYILSIDASLSDLINSAGGYIENAYPFGGFLNNKNAQQVNIIAKEKLYDQYIDSLIIEMSGIAQSADGTNPLIFEELRNAPVSGRIIAEFDIDAINSNPSLDTLIEDGDVVTIPYNTQQVFVYGQVSNNGATRFKSGLSVLDYIEKSGGTLKDANLDNIYVAHPNGRAEQYSANLLRSRNNELVIYPGSIIYIPRESNMTNTLEIAAVIAPIVSGLATSLASLSILRD